MPSKAKEKTPDLFEYRISFKIDQRASIAQRHYLAHNARDALGMFAYAILKSLYQRKDYEKKEFIVAKEFVKLHDKALPSPKFQLESLPNTPQLSTKSKPRKDSSIDSLDVATKLVKEMDQRIELIKLEEFNRWATRWYSLKLPLEEIQHEDNP